jgi:hypothetical protein
MPKSAANGRRFRAEHRPDAAPVRKKSQKKPQAKPSKKD